MDKKIALLMVTGIVVVSLVGGLAYYYIAQFQDQPEPKTNQNIEPAQNTAETLNNPLESGSTSGQAPEIKLGGDVQGGGLIICADKCGDGVCQALEEKCDNLNCICKEDVQECPSDCK